jgi:hypothetical protein
MDAWPGNPPMDDNLQQRLITRHLSMFEPMEFNGMYVTL